MLVPKNLYVTNGAQIRKLAKPIIKKVGTNFCGKRSSNQIVVSAELAHKSMKVQNTRNVIFSVITYGNWSQQTKVAELISFAQ